jgi:Xaa-Pro aminopeptidase
MIVHAGREFESRAFTQVRNIRTYSRLSNLPLAEVLAVISDLGLAEGRIGAELGSEMVIDLPYLEFEALHRALPGVELVDASSLLWRLRMVKSPGEIAAIARACEITSAAYAATFPQISSGMSEAEIERLMRKAMMDAGGANAWVLITSGEGNYDLVSKGGGPRRIGQGDMVWMDAGCTVERYYSDLSRAGVVGGASKAQRDAQEEIHAITKMGLEMMRPGVRVADIAASCSAALVELGLPATSCISDLAGRVGHGLGMLVTELPSINTNDPTVIEPGMVLTIEPGIATVYGTFHVEENVVVTCGEPRVLSAAEWELWDI